MIVLSFSRNVHRVWFRLFYGSLLYWSKSCLRSISKLSKSHRRSELRLSLEKNIWFCSIESIFSSLKSFRKSTQTVIVTFENYSDDHSLVDDFIRCYFNISLLLLLWNLWTKSFWFDGEKTKTKWVDQFWICLDCAAKSRMNEIWRENVRKNH